MRVDLLSLFPGYFQGPLDESMLRLAREKQILDIRRVNIRDFAEGKHLQVDDRPFGGGPGMVLKPGPVKRAIQSVRTPQAKVIYLSPQGTPLTAQICRDLADEEHLVLLCGHYEGIDERVLESEVDVEYSIGDYVLTTGCLAALVLLDAVSRFIPGVIGNEEAAEADSFEEGRFDCPHYTRPALFEGSKVPDVLLSGNHAEIEAWRREKGWEKTRRVRPDLIAECEAHAAS